ncbi:MAG TPA: hypothetical protein VMB21_12030 [Candidatus Limnocylindria bacterium]|jgi:hypothetical protein|nr:hypothetical protein [Candidatus Limnocylindria bacterium]
MPVLGDDFSASVTTRGVGSRCRYHRDHEKARACTDAKPGITASLVYREAWERGLKTTYYLRTLKPQRHQLRPS